MKRLLSALIVIVLLAGCASQPLKVWWNPLTWGTNRAATVQAIGDKQAVNDQQVTTQAQREINKTAEALKFADQKSRPVQVAIRTSRNALSLLAISNGPLDLGDQQADQETIAQLLSDKIELQAKGEAKQKASEITQAELSRINQELEAQKTEALKKLEVSYESERKLANQVRNFWFVVVGLIFLLLVGRLLSFASRFVPALAGAAHVVNGLAAPALAEAEARAKAGLQKVGEGLAAVRARLPALMEEVRHQPDAAAKLDEKITRTLDSKTDADHQAIIGAAANNALRP